MYNIDKISEVYYTLQDTICEVLEKADNKGRFTVKEWQKEIGVGRSCVLQNGNKIEKAGVNFSNVQSKFTPKMKELLGEEADFYSATGISSIIHGRNPFVPTIHMNVRYFALDNNISWFGGGIDLTPVYIDLHEAFEFHSMLKKICSKYSPDFYSKYKSWADDYFFLPHRDETRGIGGIFFDRLKPSEQISFDQLLQFTIELADIYPRIYADILNKKSAMPFTDKNISWQKLRRGRYVEFNLLFDRGTKFGIESGGNTESILVSMPSEATWEFEYEPAIDSQEYMTLQMLKKGINWIDYNKAY